MRHPSPGPLSVLLCLSLALVPPPELVRDRAPRDPDRAEVEAVIGRLGDLLQAHYVFPEVARECALRLRSDLEAGVFDRTAGAAELAVALTRALQEVSHDRHLHVSPRRHDQVQRAGAPALELAHGFEALRRSNFGFERVEHLAGNVGYLELSSFAPEPLVRDTLAGAMAFLAQSDAVVIDLRGNGGGSPETVRLLCSYFFEEPTHLNSLYFREGNVLREFWTEDGVARRSLVDVPLFVLTSSFTFSGAEEFAYNLRTRERATLVGETTGGGANPGESQVIDEVFEVFIPDGRAVNPVTGTNWEGTGVAPHVEVPADAALDRALALARGAAAERAGQRFTERLEILRAIQGDVHAAAEAYGRGQAAEGASILAVALEDGVRAGALQPPLLEVLARLELEAQRVDVARGILDVPTRSRPRAAQARRSSAKLFPPPASAKL